MFDLQINDKIKQETFGLDLSLTRGEVEMLRNAISDLGYKDKDCVGVQLKVANALLEAGYSTNG